MQWFSPISKLSAKSLPAKKSSAFWRVMPLHQENCIQAVQTDANVVLLWVFHICMHHQLEHWVDPERVNCVDVKVNERYACVRNGTSVVFKNTDSLRLCL